MATAFTGIVRKGKVVLKDASAFPEGTEVLVSPLVPGSPQEVLSPKRETR